MNKHTFLKLVPVFSHHLDRFQSDRIFVMRLSLDDYEYDYSHAIVEYMKECGCKIKRTNWNSFGGFYIYYTANTKYVDPVEYIDRYKGGKHYDSLTVGLFKVLLVCVVLLLSMILINFFY